MKTIGILGMIAMFATVVFDARGQLSLTPSAGVNSTHMNTAFGGYQKGGTYAFWGLDVNYRLKPSRHQKFYPTISAGVSRLDNGFYYNYSFAFKGINYYEQEVSDLKTSYWQVPVTLRINWQPFPLVEDWKVFVGGGAVENFLVNASLHEEYTHAILNAENHSAFPVPPETTHYEDDQNIKQFGQPTALFGRMELGMKFKRLQLSWRLSWSVPDLYFNGLETVWKVPATDSNYIKTHQNQGKIKEKYSEIAVGYRIGKE